MSDSHITHGAKDSKKNSDEEPAKPRKISIQEVCSNYARLLTRSNSAKVIFPTPFPYDFRIYEPERGVYQIIEVKANKEVSFASKRAVTSALLAYSEMLLDINPVYKITSKLAGECYDYWLGVAPRFVDPILPVALKSTDKHTFKKLPYDMVDMPTPLFDDFLAHITNETNRTALMAFTGSLFDPHSPRQQYLWLVGQGKDGKGSFCRLLMQMFGNAYVSLSTDPKNLNQFFNSRLVGKRVGVFQDCENRNFVKSETFMMLSGGDPVFVESKGKDGYTATLDTKFIFSSNHMPNITGKKAHLRRAIICEMSPRSFYTMKESEYEEALLAEAPGILKKCWDVYKLIRKDHGLIPVDESVAMGVAQENESNMEDIFSDYFEITGNPTDSVRRQVFFDIMRKRLNLNNYEMNGVYQWLKNTYKMEFVRPDATTRHWICPGMKQTKGIIGLAEIKEAEY